MAVPEQPDAPDCCIVHVSEKRASTRTKLLDNPVVTVGRGDDCGIVISSAHVSRLHAQIVAVEAGWQVEDTGSANGVRLNGRVVNKAVLKFGDRVDLGRGEILLFRPYDRSYQDALEAQKLESLGRLASGIAHDFNNVLMAILGAATSAEDELKSQMPEGAPLSEATECFDDIRTATSRGADLARQLLRFSQRHESGNARIAVRQLIDKVTRLVLRTFDSNINTETQLLSRAVVLADPGHLYQIMMNVCINARDAMPHGGDLKINVHDSRPKTKPIGDFVCIEVSDTGVGMSDETRDRIFEPFFSTKGEGKGTGLGMATTYGIVSGYGGTIEIDSSVGSGTTIRIFLPALQGGEDALKVTTDLTTQHIRTPAGAGRHILLAEDQELVRRHSARVLRRLGFKVTEARDGIEAVDAVREAEQPFCMAMLDLQMPRRSGDEACRQIRELDPLLPVVMVSGNIDDPRIETLQEAGQVGVLGKPFSPDQLALALQLAR